MYAATISAIVPKMPVSTVPENCDASSVPITTPAKIPGAQLRNRSKSTAPRRECARNEANEVKTMVESEVPTATCIFTSSGSRAR